MINNSFDLICNQFYNTKQNFDELAKFVSLNRTQISLNTYNRDILRSDRISISPIMKLYQEYQSFLLDNNMILSFIAIPKNISNQPQLLTLPHMDIDMLEVEDVNHSCYSTIASYPEFANKIIMNISADYDPLNHKVKNLTGLASRIVRDVLCRSYVLTKRIGKWMLLTNELLLGVAEIYAWVISYNIARIYNLQYQDQKTIAIVLALYFIQKCFNEKDKFISIYKHIRRIGPITDINETEQKIKSIVGGEKELGISDVVDIITTLGPDYMKDFNLNVFFRACRTFHVINILSLASIEYPPLWLYNIITAISAENKSNMYWSMQKTNLLKQSRELVNKLLKSITADYVFERS